MARGQHRPSCARTWRERAAVEGWSVWQTAQAIHDCCGVRLLKAHRLAQGWTAREAIAELEALCRREHLGPPQANMDLLNAWENGRARPRPDTIDRLARLYRANAIRLGLATDYSDDETGRSGLVPSPRPPERGPEIEPPADLDVRVITPAAVRPPSGAERRGMAGRERTELFYDVLADSGLAITGELLAEVEALRRRMDRTLAAGTVTEGQMDVIDETVLRYRREYVVTPPLPMLCQLMLEFSDVTNLATHRQSATVQRRLSHVTASLAVLAADALMKLGDIRQAHAWYGTATTAADDTADPRLRALVRAQEAMLPYYYGDLAKTVRLAREAQAIGRTTPCSPTALAAAAEGRALARMGDHAGARDALNEAQRIFSKIRATKNDTIAFEFSERRLYLYLSGAHAHLPDHRHGAGIQDRALALHPNPASGIDRALILLDQATCLATAGNASEAHQLTEDTMRELSAQQRTRIIFVRARDVREAIPTDQRRPKIERGFDDLLSLGGREPPPPPGPPDDGSPDD